jgi:hypothetical protein
MALGTISLKFGNKNACREQHHMLESRLVKIVMRIKTPKKKERDGKSKNQV